VSAEDQPSQRAILVCSPGGHLQQMLALRPAWEGLTVTWATLEAPDSTHILAGQDVVYGHGPTNRSRRNLLRNLVVAWRTIRSRRPDVILSTGAGLAVPFFWVGRLLGVKLIYVESLARSEDQSLTARLVRPVSNEVFVQWPAAQAGAARYVGSIL
jgi:UDP-N-acetylglucosamine:LPS N-acetylglucosamine transferase